MPASAKFSKLAQILGIIQIQHLNLPMLFVANFQLIVF
jgi:hypothetical protein